MRVCIVDRDPLYRTAVRLYLMKDPEFTDILEAGDVASAASKTGHRMPDVFLIDTEEGEGAGLDTIRRFRPALLRSKIIALFSVDARSRRKEAFDAGADACAYKYIDNERLVRLIKDLCNGMKAVFSASPNDTEVYLPESGQMPSTHPAQ